MPHERKQRLLTRGRSTMSRGIHDALVLKDRDLYFVCARDGNVPVDDGHGLGLYFHDCRYLSGYELKVGDVALDPLVATDRRGYEATIELSNAQATTGRYALERESVGIRWDRIVDGDRLTLHDVIAFKNFDVSMAHVPVSIAFRADFSDLAAVRSLIAEHPGRLNRARWSGGRLELGYDGADGIHREAVVSVEPAPDRVSRGAAEFTLKLRPQQQAEIRISVRVAEQRTDAHQPPSSPETLRRLQDDLRGEIDEWRGACASLASDNPSLDRAIGRSLEDLRMLRTYLDGRAYFSAGVPWFVALFGRDSILSALQTLAFVPDIARSTLQLLAGYQGQRVDDWRDEQPGKMPHELRVGELAHLGDVPHTPYYGTVDATPLFLILLARYVSWTGDVGLFHELRPNVDRALAWIDEYGDPNHTGFVTYSSSSSHGLINQGWKDSGDAIVDASGRLARPPIALAEVQGYVYAARIEVAAILRHLGEDDAARRLEDAAASLRERFERDFWMADEGAYALALQRDGAQAHVVSSNAGQVLWSGIAGDDHARYVVRRLMAPDMFAGWGVRTLSAGSMAYNPVGYHLGTVWPHDNSIIAAGFRRYGFADEARRIFDGLLDAASRFRLNRLPEVFAGFATSDYEMPVQYPVACHPQAWAAGSLPYLMQTCLGLHADALRGALRIERPIFPGGTRRIELRALKVGGAHVDLLMERDGDRPPRVEVLDVRGQLAVDIEL